MTAIGVMGHTEIPGETTTGENDPAAVPTIDMNAALRKEAETTSEGERQNRIIQHGNLTIV